MKGRVFLVLGAAVGAIIYGGASQAHHSFPAVYQIDEESTLRGTLVAFMYRNPHSFVHLNVTDEDTGETVRYAIEWGSATFLAGQGITREDFKVGDEVIITGNPGRIPEDHRMRMRYIERVSDGFKWPGEHQDRAFD